MSFWNKTKQQDSCCNPNQGCGCTNAAAPAKEENGEKPVGQESCCGGEHQPKCC